MVLKVLWKNWSIIARSSAIRTKLSFANWQLKQKGGCWKQPLCWFNPGLPYRYKEDRTFLDEPKTSGFGPKKSTRPPRWDSPLKSYKGRLSYHLVSQCKKKKFENIVYISYIRYTTLPKLICDKGSVKPTNMNGAGRRMELVFQLPRRKESENMASKMNGNKQTPNLEEDDGEVAYTP